jgi:maleylacetoacetate isomerase
MMTLYSYYRSSAAYRVRLALAWKRLDAAIVPIDLRTGAQTSADYRARNPQGFLPLLVDGTAALAQSLAIIEYLDEIRPDPPLLPAGPVGRARVRAAALIVVADIHPLNNLRVRNRLASLGHDAAAVDAWTCEWMVSGLTALEAFAAAHGGAFLHGDSLSLADLCLVPQLYNARRTGLDLQPFSRLVAAEAAVLALPFAAAAHPDNQPDADPA